MLPSLATIQPGLSHVARRAAGTLDRLIDTHGAAAADRAEEAARILGIVMPGRRYGDLPAEVVAATDLPGVTPILFATLLATLPTRLPALRVPDDLLPELAAEAARILGGLPDDLAADADRKDLSIALGLSLPCVAQLIEAAGTIDRRAAIAQPFRPGVLRHLLATRCAEGPYLEIHTHTPMLSGFTEPGWRRCYQLAAALLRARPRALGVVGGSWFYDPAVARISPRLAYLSDLPLAAGAFRVRIGASAEDRALATATSPSRRALAEAGRYTPEKWQLVWPREALLDWAEREEVAGWSTP